jgi:hypothetical protein
VAKSREKTEFGDFQTPRDVAEDICHLLQRRGERPNSMIEPNCGVGNFLIAALDRFPSASTVVGLEVNGKYVAELRGRLKHHERADRVRLVGESFFNVDWQRILEGLPEPLLVIGNPPWVTSAELGTLDSTNLPHKSNFQRHVGLDAITGKSNFDISEWMLLKELDWLSGRRGTLAMLCKTIVARKVLLHAWQQELPVKAATLYLIDARKHFDAAVDACLLVCSFVPDARSSVADVYASLDAATPNRQVGCRNGRLIADVAAWERWNHLERIRRPLTPGPSPRKRGEGKTFLDRLSGGDEAHGRYTWRSGVKHDCAKVMEFQERGNHLVNGLAEKVSIELDYLYPLLKGSEVARDNGARPTRWMLVPQRSVGEDTAGIARGAPRTWDYLVRHAELLDRRRSSIYRNRPRFPVFGVGDYTFAPWKVAIAGLYKQLQFRVVGRHQGKPVVLDDTAYFVACQTKAEAELLCHLLNSPAAQEFYSAFVFWDSKRPITVDLLKRLDLRKVADEVGHLEEFDRFTTKRAGDEKRQLYVF